jgi:hypothetical protein
MDRKNAESGNCKLTYHETHMDHILASDKCQVQPIISQSMNFSLKYGNEGIISKENDVLTNCNV